MCVGGLGWGGGGVCAECKFVRSMEILQLEIYSICKLQLFDRNYNLTMKVETGCRNLGSVVQNLAKDEQRCCIRIHFNTCQNHTDAGRLVHLLMSAGVKN